MANPISNLINERKLMSGGAATGRTLPSLEVNRLVRNTYLLLSMTLLFSAGTAALAFALNLPTFGIILTLGGYMGLLFAVTKCRNSTWGLFWVFMLTGFMGLTLGPILNLYVTFLSNGAELVMLALAGTGTIFLALSGYTLISRKDFSFLGGFVFTGLLVAFLIGLVAYFFQLPGLALAVSGMFVLVSSGLILYQTSRMINGGETNYIMATVGLYLALYNLFISLLHLLAAFSGRD